jgi:two-component system, sensor histidine kinase
MVLLIEDNDDLRETLKAILEEWGHRVAVAADGVAGVELALSHRPDIVLIDIGLPMLDGYQVAKRVRDNQDGYTPILIALTGRVDQKRALDAGFDVQLVKPVMPDDLARTLAEAHAT